MTILNEQKHNWYWEERLFYLFSDGSAYELKFLWKKSGWNNYEKPDGDVFRSLVRSAGNPVARIIAKTKVDYSQALQKRQLTYIK